MSLPCHIGIFIMLGELVPLGEHVPPRDGAVRFRHAVHMDREQVEVGHLLKEVRGRWAGSYGHPDRAGEDLGVSVGAEQGVDGRGGVEVRDAFFLEKFPDQGIVDLA